jgi:hypothetical protein
MFTYPMLLGASSPVLKELAGSVRPQRVSVRRKAIYAISLVLLGGALIIQSVWGADGRPPELLNGGSSAQARAVAEGFQADVETVAASD